MKQPSLAKLIESAIGQLAINQIKNGEINVIREDQVEVDLRGKILLLQSMINGASVKRRNSPEVIEKISLIMRSVEITCAPEFIVFLARKYPNMMSQLSFDERISSRIRHLYRVAGIGACFSAESLSKLNGSIDSVRRKVFEISQN